LKRARKLRRSVADGGGRVGGWESSYNSKL
jgi:hypothetical protein